MLIEIPQRIVEEMMEAVIIQKNGDIKSSDIRGEQVQRMEKHIAEIVCGIIEKEMIKRKYIWY